MKGKVQRCCNNKLYPSSFQSFENCFFPSSFSSKTLSLSLLNWYAVTAFGLKERASNERLDQHVWSRATDVHIQSTHNIPFQGQPWIPKGPICQSKSHSQHSLGPKRNSCVILALVMAKLAHLPEIQSVSDDKKWQLLPKCRNQNWQTLFLLSCLWCHFQFFFSVQAWP